MRVDEMPAGREMDKAISQRVFGSKKFVCRHSKDDWYVADERNGIITHLPVPRYFSDIGAAMTILDRIKSMGRFWITIDWDDLLDRWVVIMRKFTFKYGDWGYHDKWEARDKALEVAICKCALKAMGVTEA